MKEAMHGELVMPRGLQSAASTTKSGFISHKCLQPIPYPSRCCRDALIQATLDRRVRTIRSAQADVWRDRKAIFAFDVALEASSCLVLIDGQRNAAEDPATLNYDAVIPLARAIILSEPVVSTARMIWAYRQHIVSAGFEQDLVRVLLSHPDGIALKMLRSKMPWPSIMVIEGTLALTCRGVVELDAFDVITETTNPRISLVTPFIPKSSSKSAAFSRYQATPSSQR